LKGLIITADDFGRAPEVNDAVEKAHREGVLTSASLMIGAPAAADAVARARTMPKLGVGLHLVLTEGRPVLPRRAIPSLIRADGEFRNDMVRMSFEMALSADMRGQLADEIEAQFKAFAATGLKLDHVNAHKHFHLHPAIAGLIFEIGRRYDMNAMRVPCEPAEVLRRIEPQAGGGFIERLWGRQLGRRAAVRGIWSPQWMFGLAWSGAMTAKRLAGLIAHLPEGVGEIYLHPATGPYPGSTPGYRYAEELDALTSKEVVDIIEKNKIQRGSFGDFALLAHDAKVESIAP
jgi:chitin disaccharide deacetylase